MSKVKYLGEVYTPKNVVDMMIDNISYKDDIILNKHIIDNSCGDGAFLKEIVNRYCDAYYQKNGSYDNIEKDLSKYIHGIEIQTDKVEQCINNLDSILKERRIKEVRWDILNADSIQIDKYNNKMDYVVGNPPYVRIHNLVENYDAVKSMKFSSKGMTDLFIVFYEIGINMLNDTGILSYITPTSITNSRAGTNFRKYIIDNFHFESFINLKHYQPFQGITAYTGIFTLNKSKKNETTKYFQWSGLGKKEFISELSPSIYFINNNFYFSNIENLNTIKKILTFPDKKYKNFFVKNGIATLADKIFISKNFLFDSKYIIPAYKASTGNYENIIFPYDINGNLKNFSSFEKNLQDYFLNNKDVLNARSIEKNGIWYGFGRTQGIKDVYKEKISINTLIKAQKDIKLNIIDPGIAIYSGLYITGDISFKKIKEILDEDFIKYIEILGKYKNGGYYTFSTSDLKKYICYKLYAECLDNNE
ncbi:HsdM family class I SAM-dependent methyltransferase [Mycoplasma sp. 4013]